MGGRAKKPTKTSEEKARERVQAREIDEEIAESERRFKALARGKLGAKSLLAGTGGANSGPSAAPKGVYGKNPKVKKTSRTQAAPMGDFGGR